MLFETDGIQALTRLLAFEDSKVKNPGCSPAQMDIHTRYTEYRIVGISVLASIGFPLYYVIWTYIFPQPYENLGLRLFGTAIFIPCLFHKKWPHWLCPYKTAYWNCVLLYTLPFFFAFMLLKNNGSSVWQVSVICALFLMTLWLDWKGVITQLVIGVSLAFIGYKLTTDTPLTYQAIYEYIPVYLFAIIAGIVCTLTEEHLKRERMVAMLAAASNIAHELRTPLLGIKSGADGLLQYLPHLLEAYELAKNHGLPVAKIRCTHLDLMNGVLQRIVKEADYSNTIIDILLMNAKSGKQESDSFHPCSIRECIETALARYPFTSDKEKSLIEWDKANDFSFWGTELLMTHVLFNLLKNALYYIAKANKGKVEILVKSQRDVNQLIFRDTGTGIPAEIIPNIFSCFFTWASDGNSGYSSGIGLAFCKSVMESFGGSISCNSLFGEYTELILSFPKS